MINSTDPDLMINVVAVGTRPVIWQVWCEICDEMASEPTTDGELADTLESEHRKFHGYSGNVL